MSLKHSQSSSDSKEASDSKIKQAPHKEKKEQANKPPHKPQQKTQEKNKPHPSKPVDQPEDTPEKKAPLKKKNPALNIRALLIGMSVLLLFVTMAGSILVYITAGNNSLTIHVSQLNSRPYFSWDASGDEADGHEINETILFYVSNMDYSPQNILRHLNGSEAVPVFFNLEYKRIYCAIPRERFSGVEDFSLLTEHPEYIERAERLDDRLVLGEYHLSNVNSVFFSFPAEDLRIDSNAVIEVDYPSAVYRLPLTDLVQYHYNRNMYGTFYLNQCRDDPERLRGQAIQLPAFVVYPGEPSLAALVNQLTGDDYSIEKRTQRLLDFVSREIRPDQDLVKSSDKLKKVNEILMTGSCGLMESVILYASLLEQTEIDYLIAYTDNAAAILVEGDYPVQRGALVMRINGKNYHLADPTCRNFVIGQPAGPEWQKENVRYIQRAGINSTTFSVETGLPN